MSIGTTVEQNTAFVQKSATIYDTCQLASSERVGLGVWGVVVLSFHLLPLSADRSERGRAAIYHLWIMARDNVIGEGTPLFSKKLVLCTRRGVGWMYEGVVENLLLLATCTSLTSLRPSGWVAEKFRLAPHSNHPIVLSVCLSVRLSLLRDPT